MGIKYALTLLCILEIFHIPETHQFPLNSSEVRENKQNKIRNPQDQDFGRPCNYLNRCSGDTWCSKDERCTCKRSYHLNDTLNCVQGNGLVGSICFNGLGCEHVHNTKCSVEKGRGKCVCPAGFHGIEGGTQCAEDSKIGDPCGSKTQCTGNSECKAKHGIANCTCKQGFYANDNLVCVQGNALIGSHCFNGLGCEFVRNAKCSLEKGKGECICPAGFHGAEGGAQCTAYIDEPCKGDDSCIDNAFCTLEKICKCKDHYTASSGREKCLAYSKIGDPCGSVLQCTGNSECKAKGGIGYCTCKEGFDANDNLVCVKGNAHIGSNCSSGLGCEYVGNSKCSVEKGSGKCVCPAGFHGVEGSARCAVDSKIGDPCGSVLQCTGNSECKAKGGIGYCTCKEGFHANDNLVCVKGNAHIGSNCSSGLGCEYVGNSKCSVEKGSGKCVCPAGFHVIERGARCAVGIDGPCKGDDSCIDNAFCTLEKICKCKNDYTASSGRVKCLARIDGPCKGDDSCIDNAFCTLEKICKCKNDYTASSGRVKCLARIYGPYEGYHSSKRRYFCPIKGPCF
ncbi:multiple epidermal growth factor-like domains protein 10 isoform X2 [Ischnura elegans]|uniref:multiple epidermal growth factor-like domains protein 10 isoform X2 n=1 Tax=Ischnura elegans TaxID=197161 RepID=UPI001ED86723|nr:multiple epidermal growth factor-like domains protein 10 isoform X2 [Ischnura elegans]